MSDLLVDRVQRRGRRHRDRAPRLDEEVRPRHLSRLDVDAVAVNEAPPGVDGALERLVLLLEGGERRARLRADVLLEGRVGDELPRLAAPRRLVVRDVAPAVVLRAGAALRKPLSPSCFRFFFLYSLRDGVTDGL